MFDFHVTQGLLCRTVFGPFLFVQSSNFDVSINFKKLPKVQYAFMLCF